MDRTADAAVRAIDMVLSERPNKVGHDFSEATRRVAAYRDELIEIWRRTGSEADRLRMARVNAVLSVMIAGNYPLGPIPWPHIEKARTELAGLAGHRKPPGPDVVESGIREDIAR
jgi:hypothetical protein